MKIHAYDKTISQIFNSEVRYVIPRFQREYSWKKDEINEFWNDIIENIEENGNNYENKEYFIGSLVLVQEGDYAFHIVDGQQRLTTITVFFSALIEAFLSKGKENLAKGLYSYVEGQDLNSEKFFKLVNENPKPFFQMSIQNYSKEKMNPDTKEELRLNTTYEFFFHKLKELEASFDSLDNYIKYLVSIRDQLLSLKTIFISVNNMDEAYTIFETLNSKGINLTTTDLIKNDIFKILNYDHPVDEAKDKWKMIIQNTKSDHKDMSINTFIRHFWLSKYEFITQNRLYKAYKKQKISGEKEMRKFLDNLYNESEVYRKISYPKLEDWQLQEERDIYFSLKALSIFRVTQPKTIILSLLAKRADKSLSIKQVTQTLKLLESFHFIFTAVCSDRAAGLESKYSTIARKIRNSKSKSEVNSVLHELKEYLSSKIPNYERFERDFAKLKYSNDHTPDKKLIQYIFSVFEHRLQETGELTIGSITLEHIIPQSTGAKRFDEIGNLIPLNAKLNQLADTKPFPKKLSYFGKSKLAYTQKFVSEHSSYSDWTDKDINNRNKAMAKEAYYHLWGLSKGNQKSKSQLSLF